MIDLITSDEYADLPDLDSGWLIPGLLAKYGITLLAGLPSEGKSYLGLTLAHAVAHGTQFLGYVPTRGKVVILNPDRPGSEWKLMLAEMKAKGADLAGEVYYIHPKQMPYPFYLDRGEVQRMINLAINHVQPSLIVVDAMRRLGVFDENSSQDIEHLFSVLKPFSFNRAILLLHHARKVKEDHAFSDPVEAIRGSTDIPAHCVGTWLLHRSSLAVDPRYRAKVLLPLRRSTEGWWVRG